MTRGAALPMVLLSLALVAALSVGGAFVTRRYAADGRLLERSSDLQPAIEKALVLAATQSDTGVLKAMPVGATAAVAAVYLPSVVGMVTKVWVTRLTASTFLFVGDGNTTYKPLWHKRLNLFVALDSAGVQPLQRRPWGQLP